MTFELKK